VSALFWLVKSLPSGPQILSKSLIHTMYCRMNTRFTRIVISLRTMRTTPLTSVKVGLLIIIGRVAVSFSVMKIGMWSSAGINASRIFSFTWAWFELPSSPPKWSFDRRTFSFFGLCDSVSSHTETKNFIC
jgi:hypothetical protein